jgi:hypothetical protein
MKKQGSYVDLTQGATEDVHKHILSNGYVLVVVVWAENVSLFLFRKRRIKLYSRVDSFPEPRTFFVSLFLRVIFSLSPNGAREREEEREREIHASSRSIARGGFCDFVWEKERARACSFSLGLFSWRMTNMSHYYSIHLFSRSTKKNTHIIETSYSHLSSFIHYIITENKMVPRSNQRSCVL